MPPILPSRGEGDTPGREVPGPAAACVRVVRLRTDRIFFPGGRMRAAVVAVVAAALLPLVAAVSAGTAIAKRHAGRLHRLRLRHLRRAVAADDGPAGGRTRSSGASASTSPGMNRACDAQPNLTRRWVAEPVRARAGGCCRWSSAGRRRAPRRATTPASGSPPDPRARLRGRPASRGTPRRTPPCRPPRRLGIGRHSVLWFDLEHFDITVASGAASRRWRSRPRGPGSCTRCAYQLGVLLQRLVRHPDGRRRAGAGRPRQLHVRRTTCGSRSGTAATPCGQQLHRRAALVAAPPGAPVPRRPRRAARRRRGSTSTATSCRPARAPAPGRPAPACGVRISFRSYPRARAGRPRRPGEGRPVPAPQAGRLRRQAARPLRAGTQRAVTRFQRRHGRLPVDGDLGAAAPGRRC